MMFDPPASLSVAEPASPYHSHRNSQPPSVSECWVEVLVDIPQQRDYQLYTYRIPPHLSLQPGDVVTVPVRSRVMGGIIIRTVSSPPTGFTIKEVQDLTAAQFLPLRYIQWLGQIAGYYLTDYNSVVRTALPTGLFRRSQQYVILKPDAIPEGAEIFCSRAAQAILALLRSQPQQNCTTKSLKKQISGAEKGLRELEKRNWIERYLQDPTPIQPQRKQIAILANNATPDTVTKRQQEILNIIQQQGGEMWVTDCVETCRTTRATLKRLEEQGHLIIEEREILRLSTGVEVTTDTPKPLTPDQSQVLQEITHLNGYANVLLHGVTGSGKTEIYLQAIAPLLQQKKSALVLVPEIGLTPQLTDRFRARFGHHICVYHSALSEGEKYDTWRQMLTGEPYVIIGTRSAIFIPIPDLGLIILDEEHDSSFKEEQRHPTYDARTVAQWRAKLENCPLILGSATPSLETWEQNYPPKTPQNHYLSLPERIHNRPFPPIEIVDLRKELKQGNRSIFSRSLQNALNNLKQHNQQGILFIHRRGHSSFVSCRSCGYVIECPNCDISLSYHHTHEQASQLLRCHFCNYTQLHPPQCPECGSPYLKFFGTGTQRVVRELNKQFPELRAIRFDSDTTRTKGAHRALLSQFSRGEADLLVGTQMLTKGLDIEQVTLVGVVSADGLLNFSDYRASERAFQTLSQVAGRAGRGNDPGQVIIQTYTPDHPVIHLLKERDYQRKYNIFAQEILQEREALSYPPYGRLVLIRFTGLDAGEVEMAANHVAMACQSLLGENYTYQLLGPAPAKIMRINRRYRWHILLKFSPDITQLPDFSQLRELCPRSVSFLMNVDPLSLD